MKLIVHSHPQLPEICANTTSSPPELVTFVGILCPFLQTEHYLEQQMSVSRLRQSLLAVRTSLLEAGASGTADDTSQSVCLTTLGCKYENTGRVGVSQSHQ